MPENSCALVKSASNSRTMKGAKPGALRADLATCPVFLSITS